MAMHKLVKHNMLNPYFCNNRQMEAIVIFAGGKVLARQSQGWLMAQHSTNNVEFSALNDIEFKVKRKVDLTLNQSFLVGTTLYLYLYDLPDAKFLGEQVANSTTEQDHYGVFIEFTSSTRHNEEQQTQRCMIGPYCRTVKSEALMQLEELRTYLSSIFTAYVSIYDVKDLVKKKADLIERLNKIN